MGKLVAYLDDLLIIGSTKEEAIQSRDCVLFLLQKLGFSINWEKSELRPSQEMEFLGMIINSTTMTVWLPKEKVQKLLNLCQDTLKQEVISLRNLASLIGKLQATSPAISMAPMQVRALQQDLIKGQQQELMYESEVKLSLESLGELRWWVNNITLSQGAPMKMGTPDTVIYTDASSGVGWGAFLEGGRSTGGVWTKEEKADLHINELELLAAEIALKTFLKDREAKLVHIFMDNMTALHYLTHKGGTKSVKLTLIAKRIWELLDKNGIMITASWIPSKENKTADWRSRQRANSSEWELSDQIFQKLTNRWGLPEIDCFASRIMRKLPLYISLNPDPESLTTNALYQNWGKYPYLFPPFCLMGRVLKILINQETPKALLIAPLWPGQPWFPILLSMLIAEPILIPQKRNSLLNHMQESHPLVLNQTLHLAAFLVSGNNWRSRVFQNQLPVLWYRPGEQVQHMLTKRLGESGSCGVIRNRWIPLKHL